MVGLDMHGELGEPGTKTFGVMSSGEIRDWVLRKIGEYKKGKNMPRATSVGQCVNDFMTDSGKATPHKYMGNDVKHASAGKKSDPAHQKCTLFYTVMDETNRVGKIVGIGHHTSSTTYDLMWKRPGWVMGSSVDLND